MRSFGRYGRVAAAFLAVVVVANAAWASTWNGAGTTRYWTDANNWINGVPSNTGFDSPQFQNSSNNLSIVDTYNPWSVYGLIFSSGTFKYNLFGNALLIGPGGIYDVDNNYVTIANNITTNGNQNWYTSAGAATLGSVGMSPFPMATR